jgi:hypothetical protein
MEEEPTLTAHFYKSLEASFNQIKDILGEEQLKEEHTVLFGRIDELLKSDEKTWENAYLIQQLMIPLYDENMLEVELYTRLVEAEHTLSEKSYTYYRDSADQADPSKKRALLKRLVVDIQWKHQLQELRRVYSRFARKKTGILFVLSVLLFVATIIVFEMFIRGTSVPLFETMSIAMVAGMMGAAFSMLIGLRDRLQVATFDELKMQRRYTYILSRTIIGLGAALILTFFMAAELLTGTFFPEFKFAPGSNRMLPLDSKTISLLVVWSFIAGFSEKLVPNIISKAEAKVDIKSQN